MIEVPTAVLELVIRNPFEPQFDRLFAGAVTTIFYQHLLSGHFRTAGNVGFHGGQVGKRTASRSHARLMPNFGIGISALGLDPGVRRGDGRFDKGASAERYPSWCSLASSTGWRDPTVPELLVNLHPFPTNG